MMTAPRDICPVCFRASGHFLTWQDYELYRCGRCLTIFTDRTLDRSCVYAAYREKPYYTGNLKENVPAEDAFHLEILAMTEGTRRDRVLEVGPGCGFLLKRLVASYTDAHAIEIDPRMRDHLEKTGAHVTIAPLEEATFADEAFDLIVLREAIEHFLDPDPVMQRLARWLRPDGLLVITTPNASSPLITSCPEGSALLDAVHHPVLYAPAGLRIILGRHGLSAVRIVTDGMGKAQMLSWFQDHPLSRRPWYLIFTSSWFWRIFYRHMIARERGLRMHAWFTKRSSLE